MDQFFGRTTWIVLVGLALAMLLGVLGRGTVMAPFLLVFLFLVAAGVYVRNPVWGIGMVLAELFAFSHGHLLETSFGDMVLTSRMAVFAGVMFGWIIRLAWKRERPSMPEAILQPWILLAGAVLGGLILGARSFGLAAALDDANGYFFAFLILPITSIRWSRDDWRMMIQVFVASSVWVAALTLLTLYLFTHLSGMTLVPIYKFLRDARIGEITLMAGGFWRIFFQSQIVLIFSALLLYAFSQEQQTSSRILVWMRIFFLAAILISLSRSFWLGSMIGGILLLASHARFRSMGSLLLRVLRELVCSVLVIGAVVFLAFPLPTRIADLRQTFTERTTQFGDAAVSSRWNLLPTMWEAIVTRPVTGFGFGKSLAVTSDDPRIRAVYPDGKWTTRAFEWGWLELWLKMGVAGALAFLWLFAAYDIRLCHSTALPTWLSIGLRAGLLALLVIHVLSPYLNHPLGIGFLLFATIFLLDEKDVVLEPARVGSVVLPVRNASPVTARDIS